MHTFDAIKNFEDVKKSDFDLIFFHTEEYPFKIVQDACASLWCHVALVLCLTCEEVSEIREAWKETLEGYSSPPPSLMQHQQRQQLCEIPRKNRNGNSEKFIYILESTTDDYTCAITGRRTNGVKLCLLSDRLPDGDVCGYKRVCKKKVGKADGNKRTLIRDVIPRLLGIPYEKNMLNLVKAWMHWLRCYETDSYDESSMFCTELLTHVFTVLGILKAKHRDDLYSNDNDNNNDDNGNSDYTDEDLVLEDYVHIEDRYLSKDAWLSYSALEIIEIKPYKA